MHGVLGVLVQCLLVCVWCGLCRLSFVDCCVLFRVACCVFLCSSFVACLKLPVVALVLVFGWCLLRIV